MLSKTDRISFEALRTRAGEVENRVETHRNALHQAIVDRDQLILDYKLYRLNVLKHEMEVRGIICCTGNLSYPPCEVLVPRDEAVLIFVERADIRTRGSDYDRGDVMENSQKLYSVCPTCAQEMHDRHGWIGKFEECWKKAPFFNAFSVKPQDDGLYMRKFGEMIKLTDAQVESLNPLSNSFINRYTKEWGLPLGLKPDRDGKVAIKDFDLVSAE
jgi:hypothetical protein